MKFLNIDSPFMQIMNKVADLMILNLLTVVCMMPLITAGAALTAMHYQVLKIVRDEECYIVKGYFKAFRENFKQSTAIWLILLAIGLILGGDFYIISSASGEGSHMIFRAVLGAIAIFALFTLIYVFPVQAKFVNPVLRTLKNALAMSILQAPRSIVMLILYVLPIALTLFVPNVFPMVLLFGVTLPAFLSAKLYNRFFLKLEARINEINGVTESEDGREDDEKIFHDKLDATLEDKG